MVLFWGLFGLIMVGVIGGWYALNADSFAAIKDGIKVQASVQKASEPFVPILEEAEETKKEAEDVFVERVREEYRDQQEAAAGAVLTEAVLTEINNEAEDNYAEEERESSEGRKGQESQEGSEEADKIN